MKRISFILGAFAIFFLAASIVLLRREPGATSVAAPPAPQMAPVKTSPELVAVKPEPAPEVVVAPETKEVLASQKPKEIVAAPLPKKVSTQKGAAATKPSKGKPPRQDPIARVALSLVGVDAAAEEYWTSAINDPSLSDSEREDLIEDLNEEGFVDPHNPTVEELPLIINRLQIIEEHAPFAMDENNAKSFAEAYKDLANMFVRLTAQLPP